MWRFFKIATLLQQHHSYSEQAPDRLSASGGDKTLRAPVGARVRAVQRTNGYGSRTAHGNGVGSAFCEPDPQLPKRCDPFATYRRVSHSPVSMICRCINVLGMRVTGF
jgi:hypothetical protein